MHRTKLKSFTLSELIVVMIITVIIVGIAFTVLSLIRKEIAVIEKNYEKTTEVLLFEERLWNDFNRYPQIEYDRNDNTIALKSETDSVVYHFSDDAVLRDKDTIDCKLKVSNLFFLGEEVKYGPIDAIKLTVSENPNYTIYVFKENDATIFIK